MAISGPTALAKYLFNPLVKAGVAGGLLRGWAILETTGRKSGQLRRTPVGNGLVEGTFWVVAEHGLRAGYVRNIEANPRVRVRIGRHWHAGTARVLPEDDPRERQRIIGRRINALAVRAMGTDLLTVRIDLDGKDLHTRGRSLRARDVSACCASRCPKCRRWPPRRLGFDCGPVTGGSPVCRSAPGAGRWCHG